MCSRRLLRSQLFESFPSPLTFFHQGLLILLCCESLCELCVFACVLFFTSLSFGPHKPKLQSRKPPKPHLLSTALLGARFCPLQRSYRASYLDESILLELLRKGGLRDV
jgi:hypothetical protein